MNIKKRNLSKTDLNLFEIKNFIIYFIQAKYQSSRDTTKRYQEQNKHKAKNSYYF